MNSKNTLLGLGVALLMVVPALHADTSAHAAIVKERDTVLARIVADIESRYSVGTADEEAVSAAKLSLLAFRRDAASAASEKLKQQELVVALQEKRLSTLKARSLAGTTDSLDVLRATDAVLAAKQRLEEMKAAAKKG